MNNSASKSIFKQTLGLEQKLTGLVFYVMVKVTPFCVFVPWTIYCIFVYFNTNLGNAAFKSPLPIWCALLPFLDSIHFHCRNKINSWILEIYFFFSFLRFPFDWANPIGFLLSIAVHYAMYTYALKICACEIALGIGLYLHMIAMIKCFKQNLFAISQSIQSKCEADLRLMREQFIEYIQHDSFAKRWTIKQLDWGKPDDRSFFIAFKSGWQIDFRTYFNLHWCFCFYGPWSQFVVCC